MLLHSLVRNVTNSVNYVTKLTNINKIQNFAFHLKYQEEKTLISSKVLIKKLSQKSICINESGYWFLGLPIAVNSLQHVRVIKCWKQPTCIVIYSETVA